jgi:hypothetical protein
LSLSTLVTSHSGIATAIGIAIINGIAGTIAMTGIVIATRTAHTITTGAATITVTVIVAGVKTSNIGIKIATGANRVNA